MGYAQLAVAGWELRPSVIVDGVLVYLTMEGEAGHKDHSSMPVKSKLEPMTNFTVLILCYIDRSKHPPLLYAKGISTQARCVVLKSQLPV